MPLRPNLGWYSKLGFFLFELCHVGSLMASAKSCVLGLEPPLPLRRSVWAVPEPRPRAERGRLGSGSHPVGK
jgi:hypothetical protein